MSIPNQMLSAYGIRFASSDLSNERKGQASPMDTSPYEDAIRELVAFNQPLSGIKNRLMQTSAANLQDKTIITLPVAQVDTVLQKFLKREITAQEVHDWAHMIDVNDGIDYEALGDDDDRIYRVIYILTEGKKPLTSTMARELRETLNTTP